MKKIDIQVNGGSGLLFNDITNLNQFLKIELNHLKYGQCFIIPTFITDSFEKMQKFIDILLERMSFNDKEYKINDKTIILPKLWGIHIEGPFITNKGTHPEKYLKDFNEENVNDIIKILKPLGNLPIIMTIAPELILKDADKNAKFGILFYDKTEHWKEISDELKPQSIHLFDKTVNKKLIENIKNENYEIYVYTVNSLELANEFYSIGVDGIFTDKPDIFIKNKIKG